MLKTSKKGRPPCYKSKPGKLPNCHGTGSKTGNDRISPPIKAQVHRAVEGMLKKHRPAAYDKGQVLRLAARREP